MPQSAAGWNQNFAVYIRILISKLGREEEAAGSLVSTRRDATQPHSEGAFADDHLPPPTRAGLVPTSLRANRHGESDGRDGGGFKRKKKEKENPRSPFRVARISETFDGEGRFFPFFRNSNAPSQGRVPGRHLFSSK